MQQFRNNPLATYYSRPTIIEILGFKGNGKTVLLLRLALDYLRVNKGKKIKIFSCSGGITVYRISAFHKADYDYSDIFSIEDLLESLTKLKSEKIRSLIVLDGMVNLLLGTERQKTGLGDLLISLKDQGWSIYYTNYTQTKL